MDLPLFFSVKTVLKLIEGANAIIGAVAAWSILYFPIQFLPE